MSRRAAWECACEIRRAAADVHCHETYGTGNVAAADVHCHETYGTGNVSPCERGRQYFFAFSLRRWKLFRAAKIFRLHNRLSVRIIRAIFHNIFT